MGQARDISNAVEKTISGVVAEHGGIMTSYLGIATSLDNEGKQRFFIIEPDKGTWTEQLGLLEMLEIVVKTGIQEAMNQQREEG